MRYIKQLYIICMEAKLHQWEKMNMMHNNYVFHSHY